jgi:hypothetical protein
MARLAEVGQAPGPALPRVESVMIVATGRNHYVRNILNSALVVQDEASCDIPPPLALIVLNQFEQQGRRVRYRLGQVRGKPNSNTFFFIHLTKQHAYIRLCFLILSIYEREYCTALLSLCGLSI